MTYEEAIKHFESLQKRYTTEHNGKMCEKVALALEVMEKQIPKKPSGSFDDETYRRAWICECTGIIDEYPKFCPCCGHHPFCPYYVQVIDWNRKENEND